MASRSPSLGLILMIELSTVFFLALPVWGWGDLCDFVDHPARIGALLVVVLASTA